MLSRISLKGNQFITFNCYPPFHLYFLTNFHPFLLTMTMLQRDWSLTHCKTFWQIVLSISTVQYIIVFSIPTAPVQVCQQISAGWPAGSWGFTGAASSPWVGTLWQTGEVGRHVGSPAAWSRAATPFGASAGDVCFSAARGKGAAPSSLCPSPTRSPSASFSCSPRYRQQLKQDLNLFKWSYSYWFSHF